MTIRIEVVLVGVLQELAGKSCVPLKVDKPAVVKDVISKLTDIFPPNFQKVLIDPELNDPRPNVIVLLNKREISVLNGLETEVENGDKLVLIPVSHGG